MSISANAISLAAVMLLIASSASLAKPEAVQPVQADLIASVDTIVPGKTFSLGVRLKISPQWHTYWANPGESGAPTRIQISGPAGFEFGPVLWPLPARIHAPGGFSFGYENEVLLMVPVKVPSNLTATGAATLVADVWWLSCKDTCIDGSAKLSINMPIGNSARPANAATFDSWRDKLPVSREAAVASGILTDADQATPAGGAPLPALDIHWRAAPRKVEWFPVATEAVSIDNVVIQNQDQLTRIRFKARIYKTEKSAERIDSVLVYEDEQGRRRGISLAVRIAPVY